MDKWYGNRHAMIMSTNNAVAKCIEQFAHTENDNDENKGKYCSRAQESQQTTLPQLDLITNFERNLFDKESKSYLSNLDVFLDRR
jgi:hypothetical protein